MIEDSEVWRKTMVSMFFFVVLTRVRATENKQFSTQLNNRQKVPKGLYIPLKNKECTTLPYADGQSIP